MKKLVLILLAAIPLLAYAADIDTLDALARSSALSINPKLKDGAIRTLIAATLLQTLISYAKGIFETNGGIGDTLRKSIISITWMAIFIHVISTPDIFINFIDASLAKAAQVSGVTDFSLKSIFTDALASANRVSTIYDKISSKITEDAGMAESILIGLTFLAYEILALIIIALSYTAVLVFVFVTRLEMYVVVAVAPIMVSLGGLQAFREQALSPARSLIGLFVRLVILGAAIGFIKAGVDVFFTWADGIVQLPEVPAGFYASSLMFSIFPALGAAMAILNGKVASSLLGGGLSLGSEAALSSAANSMGSAADGMKKAAAAMTAGASKLADSVKGSGGGGGGGGGKSSSPIDGLKNFSSGDKSSNSSTSSGNSGTLKMDGGGDKSGPSDQKTPGAVGELGSDISKAQGSSESGSMLGDKLRGAGDFFDKHQAPVSGGGVSMNLQSD